jgi:hypothetical protein
MRHLKQGLLTQEEESDAFSSSRADPQILASLYYLSFKVSKLYQLQLILRTA